MSTTEPKRQRIWKQLFYAVGGVLASAAFVGAQVVYCAEYFRGGDSIRINLRYQQPMLLSSILIIAVLGDILLVAAGIIGFKRWWQSRDD